MSSAIQLLVFLLIAFLLPGSVEAQPQPSHLSVNPFPYRTSKAWLVEVWNGQAWVDTLAYEYCLQSQTPGYHMGAHPWVHWATIELQGSATIRATRLPYGAGAPNTPHGNLARGWGGITTWARIEPQSLGIQATVRQGTGNLDPGEVMFNVSTGNKVYVACNGYGGQFGDSLFIFVNPPSKKPDNAYVFEAGVHPQPIVADTGFVWYLEHGAWIDGQIDVTQTASPRKDVHISGPGVLCGSFSTHAIASQAQHKWSYSMIYSDPNASGQTQNVSISGITIVGSPWYNVYLRSIKGHRCIEHVHALSPWTANTDGFNLEGSSLVSNCFAFTNDDKAMLEDNRQTSPLIVKSVLAGRSAFLAGYGYWSDPRVGVASARDCNVIMQALDPIPSDPNNFNWRFVPFRARVGNANPGHIIERQVYSGIEIDGDVECLMAMNVEEAEWTSGYHGNMKDILFENIRLRGSQRRNSEFVFKDSRSMGVIGTTDNPIVLRNITIDVRRQVGPGSIPYEFAVAGTSSGGGTVHVVMDNVVVAGTKIDANNASNYVWVGPFATVEYH